MKDNLKAAGWITAFIFACPIAVFGYLHYVNFILNSFFK